MLTQSMKSHKSRLKRGFTSGWPCADYCVGTHYYCVGTHYYCVGTHYYYAIIIFIFILFLAIPGLYGPPYTPLPEMHILFYSNGLDIWHGLPDISNITVNKAILAERCGPKVITTKRRVYTRWGMYVCNIKVFHPWFSRHMIRKRNRGQTDSRTSGVTL